MKLKVCFLVCVILVINSVYGRPKIKKIRTKSNFIEHGNAIPTVEGKFQQTCGYEVSFVD